MANTARPIYRAPKRMIERVNSRLNHTMTNAAATKTLHTVEDRKTLVRSILQLEIVPNSTPGTYTLVLERLPRANSVGTPGTAESLDSDMIKEQLWSFTGGFNATSTEPKEIFVDLGSMRKLDPGDTVVLKTITDAANMCDCMGNITLFFKE